VTRLTIDRSKNPCIGKCSTSLGDKICKGCGRTFEEVDNWNRISQKEKELIIKRVRGEKNG